MLLGVIADDFTGASDIANTIARGLPGQGGLVSAQYIGVPQGPADRAIEAGVVSLKTRSSPVDEAVSQSLAALEWLLAQGCTQIVFKYCSTFDSTPTGNIGPVAEALANRLQAEHVVVCPAFPGAGRTLYQGHLFVHDQLLSESGMQHHPLTPMTDPDIRRWLRRQTTLDVGFVPLGLVRRGPDDLARALRATGGRLVVVDAVADADLEIIGRACAGAALVTGGSGVAMALGANFIDAKTATGGRAPVFAGAPGDAAILAGSCSGMTRAQIAHHARSHPVFEIPVQEVIEGRLGPDQVLAFLNAHRGKAPLAYSSSRPEEVRAWQAQYGSEIVSGRLDRLFAQTARAFLERGGRRLVVAGGETSGAVVQGLDLGALRIGPEIDPGVPVLYSDRSGAALALKSGNFGQVDFFDRALDVLAGGSR